MIDWLREEWFELCQKYSNDLDLIKSLWEEILLYYSEKHRHYHNLEHIYKLLKLLRNIDLKLNDIDSLEFAIWFHDIIYKPQLKDNEEKSALLASKFLSKLNLSITQIEKIKLLILSTKDHKIVCSQDNDNAIFLDLDMSILGASWKEYQKYYQDVQKEYKIYPYLLYKKGRRKVLEGFLNQAQIFYTKPFFNLFEEKARNNIKAEISLL